MGWQGYHIVKKRTMIIDVAKCEDCNNCFLSCKDEHVDNDWPGYGASQPRHGHRWMNILRKERGRHPIIDVAYLPTLCMQCDNAPCIKVAKSGAIFKRKDGIVIIDPEKAKGQKDILKACPYESIWWNEGKDIPQKCSLCAHLLDEGWKEPRCIQACPTGALRLVYAEDSEMLKVIESEKLEALHPEYNTYPRVYYKNLYRFFRCFIGGSVAYDKSGIIDCAQGAEVTLIKDSKKVNKTVTDNYGDFRFDNLEENSGRYVIEIVFERYGKKAIEVDLKTSVSAGTICL